MHYTQTISSPLGNILLSADEVGLTGLWFDGGRYYAETLPEEHVERETPILMDTKRWLFHRTRTRLHAAAAPDRVALPADGLATAA